MHKLITKFSPLLLLLAVLAALAAPGRAQEVTMVLRLQRDFGYGDGSGRIQGLFSMNVTAPADVEKVIFQIDGQSIGEDASFPFKLQFNTDNYTPGLHTLSAVGKLPDGVEIASNEIQAQFLSPEESRSATGSIIIPLLGTIFGLMILSFAFTMISIRRKPRLPLGTPRNYGFMGGTICPKCGRPYALHFLKINLLVGRLDICPHCGKWGIVHPLPLQTLRDAEAAELDWDKEGKGQVKEMSEEEKLRKDLDDSRFQ